MRVLLPTCTSNNINSQAIEPLPSWCCLVPCAFPTTPALLACATFNVVQKELWSYAVARQNNELAARCLCLMRLTVASFMCGIMLSSLKKSQNGLNQTRNLNQTSFISLYLSPALSLPPSLSLSLSLQMCSSSNLQNNATKNRCLRRLERLVLSATTQVSSATKAAIN